MRDLHATDDGRGGDTLHPSLGESLIGGLDAAGQSDRAGGVFDDDALEVEGGTVDGGMSHAEVISQAAEEEAFQSALAQVTGQAGRREVIILQKRRVRVDVGAETFAHDEFGVGSFERGMEVRTRRPLNAVIRPERLRSVGNLNALVRLRTGMSAGEGDVTARMPVLSKHDVGELLRERVDDGYNFVAAWHGQRAAGTEVILKIDDQQGVSSAVEHEVSVARSAASCQIHIITPCDSEYEVVRTWFPSPSPG